MKKKLYVTILSLSSSDLNNLNLPTINPTKIKAITSNLVNNFFNSSEIFFAGSLNSRSINDIQMALMMLTMQYK